jgi:hypothetical protein
MINATQVNDCQLTEQILAQQTTPNGFIIYIKRAFSRSPTKNIAYCIYSFKGIEIFSLEVPRVPRKITLVEGCCISDR